MADRNFLIELTNKLYRLTLLFPKKEPLRYRIREVADDFLAIFIERESLGESNPGGYAENAEKRQKEIVFVLEKDLEVLDSYFEVAKWRNWASYFDILEVQEEYDRIKQNLIGEIKKIEIEEKEKSDQNQPAFFLPILTTQPKEPENPSAAGEKEILEPRKEKIISTLKRVERIQVGEFNKLFPDVSKRTIRRDFQKLLKQGIVERLGEKNNTFYRLKAREAGIDENPFSELGRTHTI